MDNKQHILKITDVDNYRLSSDTHFHHYNCISYSSRPFNSVYEMNATFISNWNYTVSNKNNMLFLGDFIMNPRYYDILLELNFNKMYFILGNHDKRKKLQNLIDEYELNIEIFNNLIIEVENKQYYLIHYPYKCSDEMPSIVGHVHNLYKKLNVGDKVSTYLRSEKKTYEKILKYPILNVGIDVCDYKPISLRECINILGDKNEN